MGTDGSTSVSYSLPLNVIIEEVIEYLDMLMATTDHDHLHAPVAAEVHGDSMRKHYRNIS